VWAVNRAVRAVSQTCDVCQTLRGSSLAAGYESDYAVMSQTVQFVSQTAQATSHFSGCEWISIVGIGGLLLALS
jgi:hypothetical protein